MERMARLSGACYALLLSALVAVAPSFVPLLFGQRWSEVAVVFPGACLALLVAGTAVNPAIAYLWAAGRPEIALRAVVLNATTVIVLGAALLPVLELVAIGVSLAAGAVAESLILAPTVRRLSGASLLPALPVPLAAASAGASVGWFISTSELPLGLAGVISGIAAVAVTAVILGALSWAALLDLSRVATKSLRHALGAAGET
jgi:O-antigen/teichoic acid export membrane protein